MTDFESASPMPLRKFDASRTNPQYRGYRWPVDTPVPKQIDNWQDAERNAADWMRHWGYAGARAVPGGPDSGIDVTASGAVGQVKFQGAPVGRPVLQRLVGASSNVDDRLFFFTGSNYSKAAVEYADERGIALFQYDPWGRMKPMNPVAASVQQNPGTPLVKPQGRPSPVKQHFKRHWAAWVAGYLICLPVVMIGDHDFYGNSPLWQNVLKWIGSWAMAILFLALHAKLRANRAGNSRAETKPTASDDGIRG